MPALDQLETNPIGTPPPGAASLAGAPLPDAPAPPVPTPAFWASVREALAGSHHDFSTGPLGRAILLLAVPMVLEMAMESVFAVTDAYFVGRLGADALATVGLTESMLAVVYALAMGLGVGATAVVARRTGEKDPAGAARAGATAVAMGVALSLVLGTAGALLAPRLLALMGAPPGVLATGTSYARVMLGGEASIILLFVANAIFRGAGDAAIAMRTLWLANGINIVLGPLLIFGPGPFPALGVTGAAVATTIGRSTGALYALWRLTRPTSRVRVARRDFAFDRAVVGRIVEVSGAAAAQSMIGTASWIGLVRVMATFGAPALAGYTIAMRIIVFAILPAFGMSNAAATLVGQALGARDPARAERAVWTTGHYNAAFLGALAVVFVVAAPALVGVFTRDPAVLHYATNGLRVDALGFPLYAYGLVLAAAFNGAGDARTPTVLNLLVFWAFEIPVAYGLAVGLGMGPQGVFVAIALAFSMLAVASGGVFRRGRWKTQVV
ncbi:MATE family efflux transporter [Gemmatimonadetes bacterium T265]|nr:MATE family efflux transporter [Gemmatimonadetes bacterium T265]